MSEEERKSWETFQSSGRVADYLNYRAAFKRRDGERDEINDAPELRRHYHSGKKRK